MNMHKDEAIGATTMDKAQEAADQAGKKVAETASAAKEQAKRTVSQVGEQAKTTVDSRMSEVAQELGSVADAVRQTSQELGDDDQMGIARYGNRIADQIEQVSTYLSDRGVEEVLTDVQSLARRQPALFLGGAFTLGLLVGRFMRSSSQNLSYQQNDSYSGFQGDMGGSYQGSGYGGANRGGSYSSYQGSGETRTYTRSGESSSRPSREMGAQTGANEPSYRQGPSVYNTSPHQEFGNNPTAYPTGLAETDE